MPVYVHCPHCEHPQIVAAPRRGKALFCKQCGMAYKTSTTVNSVRPLAASSIGELNCRGSGSGKGGRVYIIEV